MTVFSEFTSATTPISMQKRDAIRVHRAGGARNRVSEVHARVLWFDSIDPDACNLVLPRLSTLRYTGVVLYPSNIARLFHGIPPSIQRILYVSSEAELAACTGGELADQGESSELVVASPDVATLEKAREKGFATCLRGRVDDAAALEALIRGGSAHDYLTIAFRDPTNIPLELVIATLQATNTILVKEITDPLDVDDTIVTLGVMEVGADGVMFSPRSESALQLLSTRLDALESPSVQIEAGTVLSSRPAGMGYRSCVDLATLFSPAEGLLVGSTSQGGVLCCPEVFFLPYMELRPFRVNAGAVHSYVYSFNDRTDYMTELRAGSPVMVVDTNGKTRKACVGRMKTEMRPLRLIEVEFGEGKPVNILMQDDWHVRVFSSEGLPLNITTLKRGDRVLGHVSEPGRHVGIKVDEHIIET